MNRGLFIKNPIFQGMGRSGESYNDEAVFVKKFPRFEDPFCLGIEEKSRSLKIGNDLPLNMNMTSKDELFEFATNSRSEEDPEWVMPVPDAVTPCKGKIYINQDLKFFNFLIWII